MGSRKPSQKNVSCYGMHHRLSESCKMCMTNLHLIQTQTCMQSIFLEFLWKVKGYDAKGFEELREMKEMEVKSLLL